MTLFSLSAVICTHNRVDYLKDALLSLQNQDDADVFFEIIVVDNASTDHTRELVESLAEKDKRIKYVFENNLGLSYARNTGAAHSNGNILAYLDDDVIVQSNWLSELVKAYSQTSQEIACIAGGSELLWEGRKPKWFPIDLIGYLSSTDHLGWERRLLLPGQFPVGANFSIRKKVLDELGGFDPLLGRVGKKLISGEETKLCHLIWSAGWQICYHPDALVKHRIPSERLTKRSLLRRAYWQGVTDVMIEFHFHDITKTQAYRKSGVTFLQAAMDIMKGLFLTLTGKSQTGFLSLFTMAGRLGRVVGLISKINRV